MLNKVNVPYNTPSCSSEVNPQKFSAIVCIQNYFLFYTELGSIFQKLKNFKKTVFSGKSHTVHPEFCLPYDPAEGSVSAQKQLSMSFMRPWFTMCICVTMKDLYDPFRIFVEKIWIIMNVNCLSALVVPAFVEFQRFCNDFILLLCIFLTYSQNLCKFIQIILSRNVNACISH